MKTTNLANLVQNLWMNIFWEGDLSSESPITAWIKCVNWREAQYFIANSAA